MKKFVALIGLVFIVTVGWRVGESLSSDAASMAVGLLLGVMAGIPAALMVQTANRRAHYDERPHHSRQQPVPAVRVENHYHLHIQPPASPSHGAHPPARTIGQYTVLDNPQTE